MSISYSPNELEVGEEKGVHDNASILILNMATTEASNNSNVAPPPRYPGLVNLSATYFTYHGYIAAVVCIWGIAANLANIVVLTRKKMISSTNTILMWLAVADLVTMMSYFPVSIHFYIMHDSRLSFPTSKSIHWIQFMLFHINFTVVAHTVAIWLTIMLAMWRYLFICYPTKGSQLCSMQNAKIVIFLVYLLSAILCIPNFMATAITKSTQKLATENQSVISFDYYEFDDSYIAKTSPALKSINYWIQAFLIKLIPCGLLTVLTILLIIAMTKANKRRMQLKSQGKKDESDRAREHNRTTAMLLAVVGLFLLTEFPQGKYIPFPHHSYHQISCKCDKAIQN